MPSDIPGPRPWPLIGNLLSIDLENSVQSIVDIGKQYGMILNNSISLSSFVKRSTYLVLHL